MRNVNIRKFIFFNNNDLSCIKFIYNFIYKKLNNFIFENKEDQNHKLCSFNIGNLIKLNYIKLNYKNFKNENQSLYDLNLNKIANFYQSYIKKAPTLDLQRFAAEDEGRTELPTETKKRRAREKGQVLKSQEIVALSSLIATLFSIFVFFPTIWQRIINIVYFFFQVDLQFNIENLDYFIKYSINQLLPVFAIIFIPPIVASIIANVAQVGFLVVPSLITPNLSRIAPNFSAYFKRIFSVEGLVNLLKSLALVIGLLVIVFLAINSSLGNLFESVSDSYQKTIELGINLFKSIFIRIMIILIVIVI
ncbi:MAG: EscU/YscU/HrcU family type III secretion system export apparatus switch protein, partial [Spirochaetota bacterium]